MHARTLVFGFLFTASLPGCTRGEPQAATRGEGPIEAPQVAVGPVADPAPREAPPPREPVELPGTTIYHVNLSIVVDDPGEALNEAEKVLRKLGGEVSYASANGDNANLNGRVPVDARHQLRDALVKISGEIQSENMSTSDVSYDVRRLRRRLITLQDADSQVAALVAGNSDPDRIEAAALLRELTERERQSIESQMQSYMTQTKDGQVSVSFVKPQR